MGDFKTIEDVYNSIGGFGKFQLFALSVIYFSEIPFAIIIMMLIYVGSNPKEWTCIDEENFTETIYQFSNETQSICQCNDLNSSLYGGSLTIVAEWQLVCQNSWISDSITSVQMIGFLVGSLCSSYINDLYGRKKSMYIFCLGTTIFAICSGFSPTPIIYAVSRFLIGVCVSSYLLVASIYPVEFLTSKWRTLCGSVGPWGEGVMILAGLIYFIPDWRTLSHVAVIPSLFIFFTYPFLPESPRWLIQKGRTLEAYQVIKQMAHWNGIDLEDVGIDEITIEKLSIYSTNPKPDPGSELETELGIEINGNGNQSGKTLQQQSGYITLLKSPQFRGQVLCFSSLWFTFSLIYYGLSFNTKNLSGDTIMNILYLSLTDIFGFPSAAFVNHWLGRKRAFFAFMSTGTGSLLAIILMELNIGIPQSDDLLVYLSLFGKLSICGAWGGMKCFTPEYFPTSIRSSALGITVTSAAIGGIFSSQMVFLGQEYGRIYPFIIFSVLGVVSLGLSLLLTETKGKAINENQ